MHIYSNLFREYLFTICNRTLKTFLISLITMLLPVSVWCEAVNLKPVKCTFPDQSRAKKTYRKKVRKSYTSESDSTIGTASWYGREHHGKITASGEPFNMYAYTAAHKTLPFGTKVRVINLINGKDVVVCINDRGPFIDGRIIDLSYAAAGSIGMIESGIAQVKIEEISNPDVSYSKNE